MIRGLRLALAQCVSGTFFLLRVLRLLRPIVFNVPTKRDVVPHILVSLPSLKV